MYDAGYRKLKCTPFLMDFYDLKREFLWEIVHRNKCLMSLTRISTRMRAGPRELCILRLRTRQRGYNIALPFSLLGTLSLVVRESEKVFFKSKVILLL